LAAYINLERSFGGFDLLAHSYYLSHNLEELSVGSHQPALIGTWLHFLDIHCPFVGTFSHLVSVVVAFCRFEVVGVSQSIT